MSAKRLTKKQQQQKRIRQQQEESLRAKLQNQIDKAGTGRAKPSKPTLAETHLIVSAPTLSLDSREFTRAVSDSSASKHTSEPVKKSDVQSAMRNSIPDLSYRDSSHTQFPSAPMTQQRMRKRKKLSAALKAREAAAQLEIEKKKKRVAPLYNKGGLQYITDDMDLTTLGRKV